MVLMTEVEQTHWVQMGEKVHGGVCLSALGLCEPKQHPAILLPYNFANFDNSHKYNF